ncbi:MAG: exopolysaccharide biosynthesis polyprenyl glycosylphosphotransferase [bacterium]|nr:exopolysaccharide biosynthesis polyprenyl glycosylphosphotransferase [Candidatus Limimorpha caballi]
MAKISKKSLKYPFRSICNVITTLFVVLSFAYIWYKSLNPLLYTSFLLKGNFLVIGIYMVFVLLFMSVFGGFKLGIYTKTNIIISQTIALLCASLMQILFVIMLIGRVILIPAIVLSFFKMYIAQVVFVFFFTIVVMNIYHKLFNPYELLHIYADENDNISKRFLNQHLNYVIKDRVSCFDTMENIIRHIDNFDLVMIDDIPADRREIIQNICYSKEKKVYFVPSIIDIINKNSKYSHLLDTPLYFYKNNAMSVFERIVKRIGDIFISTVGIIITSPIMIAIAAAIFSYDKGPVFYRQTRYTKGGKIFKIIKFRSMIQNAENDGKARLAIENDERITPVGRFIRACRIDELPQFFNVLKGDMSIVGPRPERPEIADEYCKQMPEFRYRLYVKAGLTGYAQVYGKYNTTFVDKLKLDMIYVGNASILLDIQLILLTLKVIFQKESTEGLEEGETIAMK